MIYRDSDLYPQKEVDSITQQELNAYYFEMQSLEAFGKPSFYYPIVEEAEEFTNLFPPVVNGN